MKERFARLGLIFLLGCVPVGVAGYECLYRPSTYPSELRVIDLTGVANSGTWTLEPVDGLNYWWKQFEPATLRLTLGERVLLRFHSADVYHQFYIPALDFGPFSVKPGTVTEAELNASQAGAFEYYCTYMCGGCHFYMRGWVIVTPEGEEPIEPDPIQCPICLPDFGERPTGDSVALGEFLYRQSGCGTCHGIEGEGGVANYNYVNDEVPGHDETATKIFLRSEEDAEVLLGLIEEGIDIGSLEDSPDIGGFAIVRARFQAAVDLIQQGKNAARMDLEGPEPPLQMPMWKYKLSNQDTAAIMGYFVSLYEWDEDE